MSKEGCGARRPASAFISYARKDGEAFAHNLRARIERDHPDIYLWQDRNEMQGGTGWWRQIEQALAEVSFLVIVMTPAALVSEMTRKEWHYARQQGVCVFPVKGVPDEQIDWDAAPKWMRHCHFYALDAEWETFIRHLRSPCVQTRVPFMAPDLPEHFVPRPGEFGSLLDAVVDRRQENPRPGTVYLHGAGGFGKTILATALCHQDTVVSAFPDGILWVTLGERPDVLRELTRQHRALTADTRSFIDAEEAAQELAARLEDKQCLVVIDDVWRRASLEPFLRGGRGCTRLVTTRQFEVVAGTGDPLRVGEMSGAEALAMLAAALRQEPPDSRPLGELATRLGEWPLLLRLAGSALRLRMERGETLDAALKYVHKALTRKGITAFDRADADARNDAVASTVGVSLALLTEADQQRCFELAVFPEDEDIPLHALASLWQLDEFDTEETAQHLADTALVDLDLGRDVVQIHDMMRAYFGQRLPDAAAAHLRLATAWGEPWRIADPYALRWVAYHLALAGEAGRLRALLMNYQWLEHKLRLAGINALLADYGHGRDDPVVDAVQQALRQAAHVLGPDDAPWSGTDQLPSQILAGLLHRPEPEIQQLSADARVAGERGGRPWLRPLTASLRASSALLRILKGHRGRILALVALPDGRLASASSDQSIRLWNLTSGATDGVLEGHQGWIRELAAMPDGRLASHSSQQFMKHAGPSVIQLWNLVSGQPSTPLAGHGEKLGSIAALPDGRLALALPHGRITLWNPSQSEGGAMPTTLEGHQDWVGTLTMLPDGRLASGCQDGSIRLWNLQTGQTDAILAGHRERVEALAAFPDGRLASASLDQTIKLWNTRTGQVETTLKGPGTLGWGLALAALPHERLAAGTEEGDIVVWDLATGQVEATLAGHTDPVAALTALPNGRLASGSWDGTIRLWDTDTTATEGAPSTRWSGGKPIFPLPDGRFASESDDCEIELWEPTSGMVWRRPLGREGGVGLLAVLSDGRLATQEPDHSIALRDAEAGTVVTTLRGHRDRGVDLVELPDGRLASGSWDKTIRLWNAATGAMEAILACPGGVVTALAVLPAGRLAVGMGDKRIAVWDPATGQVLATLQGDYSTVREFVGLPDGRLVALSVHQPMRGKSRNKLVLVNTGHGGSETVLADASFGIDAIAALPGGRFASGSRDGAVRIWSQQCGAWTAAIAFVADAGIESLATTVLPSVLAARDALGRMHFLAPEGFLLSDDGFGGTGARRGGS